MPQDVPVQAGQSLTNEICALCAKAPATTREHVPAEMFFTRPLPDNLITVPACDPCNQGTQKEDSYLRGFLMLLKVPPRSPAIEEVRERASREFQRPEYPGLKETFARKVEFDWMPTHGGRILTLGHKMQPDPKRLQRVLTKQVRGLYYRATGAPLAAESMVFVERFFNRGTRPREFWEPWRLAGQFAMQGRLTNVGDGSVFHYAYKRPQQGPIIAIIAMLFYRTFPYVAMVLEPGFRLPGNIVIPRK